MFLLCREKLLVLPLLVIEPVGRADALRLVCLCFEPAGYRILELGLVTHPLREGDIRRPKAMPVEQVAERAQPLQLTGAVDPVARPVAGRLDEAHGLQITQHPRRPPGRLSRLVDREPVHRPRTLPKMCQGALGARPGEARDIACGREGAGAFAAAHEEDRDICRIREPGPDLADPLFAPALG